MKKRTSVYSCSICGQIIGLVHNGGGTLVCCNKPMQREMGRETEKDVPVSAPYWSCSSCHYVVQAVSPPEVCPACKQHCQFVDVSCYIPECGFTGIDSRLIK